MVAIFLDLNVLTNVRCDAKFRCHLPTKSLKERTLISTLSRISLGTTVVPRRVAGLLHKICSTYSTHGFRVGMA